MNYKKHKLLYLIFMSLILAGCKYGGNRPAPVGAQDFTVKSYPSGAKVYYFTADGKIKSEVFKDCYTPCTMRFWQNAFQGRSTAPTHVGVVWSNGDSQWATVTLKKGVNSYYGFTNKELAKAQKTQSDRANKTANEFLFRILGAYVSAKSSSRSSASSFSTSNRDIENIELNEQKRERAGWVDVDVNGKNISCFANEGDYGCKNLNIMDWSHGKGDGWHDVQINGKNKYCMKMGDTLDCR